MRAKWILNAALGLFVVIAVALVARQAMPGREPAPAPPAATSVVASAVPQPVALADPAPETTTVASQPSSTFSVATTSTSEPTASAPPATPVKALAPVTITSPKEKPAVVTPQHKVVAMYFHGDIRCATCRKVEAYAKEAVEEGFPDKIAAGGVEFRAVNVEQPENRHFIQDYQLTNKSVVVVDEVGGSVARWVKLDNVWGLVGNREAYHLYVQDAVRAYVEN